MGEPVQAFVFPVAGGRSKDEGQITWCSSVEKPALESGDDAVRGADTDEAGRGHRVALAQDGNGIFDRHDLGVVRQVLFTVGRSLMVQQPVGDTRSYGGFAICRPRRRRCDRLAAPAAVIFVPTPRPPAR